MYDLIIIGSGPAGLTLATLASEEIENKKILIIDKDKTIGGCHKVNRQLFEKEYYFSEHGPRVYIGNYINFKFILKKIGINFRDLFAKYKFGMLSSTIDIINKKVFNLTEILILSKEFLIFTFDYLYGYEKSLIDFLNENNFSDNAKNYLDKFCHIIDGGDIKRVSLNTFLHIINECMLYSIYQPKLPNDEGLFQIWYNYLNNKKIEFKLNTEVIGINYEDNKKIINIRTNYGYLKAKKVVFAIPPENLISIIQKNNNLELINYNKNAEYNEYISITFHWNYKFDIDNINAVLVNNSSWGVIAIVLSDYMKFKENNSKTVISCAITFTNNKSNNINKTANECSDKNEVINETFKQLNEIYNNNLPEPTLAFINNYYKDGKWTSNEKAFIKTYDSSYIVSSIDVNLYTIGSHNGKAKVHFTSMENAVTNAIRFYNDIYNKKIEIKRPFLIVDLIKISIYLLLHFILLALKIDSKIIIIINLIILFIIIIINNDEIRNEYY